MMMKRGATANNRNEQYYSSTGFEDAELKGDTNCSRKEQGCFFDFGETQIVEVQHIAAEAAKRKL